LFATGCTGFIGAWLLESFARANQRFALGAELIALTRNEERARARFSFLPECVRWLAGDIGSFRFPDGPLTHVIHAAMSASVADAVRAPDAIFEASVTGTKRCLDLAARHGTQRLLLLSSGAVYGRQPEGVELIDEGYPGAPDPSDSRSRYGEAKRASELLTVLAALRAGFAAVIARCFAFVGPALPLDAHYAAGNFVADVLARRPIHVASDGTARRSYLYAADLATWLWTLLLEGAPGQAYNVGAEEALSIRELAERTAAVAGTLGLSVAVRVAKASVPGQPIERYVPSTARARRELGLKAEVGIDEGLRKMLLWHLGRD
jgi:nucleoside-diphosphate-sugar epimerase